MAPLAFEIFLLGGQAVVIEVSCELPTAQKRVNPTLATGAMMVLLFFLPKLSKAPAGKGAPFNELPP